MLPPTPQSLSNSRFAPHPLDEIQNESRFMIIISQTGLVDYNPPLIARISLPLGVSSVIGTAQYPTPSPLKLRTIMIV